jgi:uncharacterized protein (DUF2141 family)
MTLPHRRALAITLALAMAGVAPATASAQAAPPAHCAGTPTSTWLNVSVERVRNGSGLIAVTLYADNPGSFLVKHGSIGVQRFPARAGTTPTCIFVPKPGVYALAVYHDENASRKLDRGPLGLPKEGFGFSNNPSTLAGIPTFRSVRLSVPRTNLSARITLRYP